MTGSRFVPTVPRRQNAPRGGVKADFTLGLPPELRLSVERSAASIGVSASYFFQLGARRFIELIHDEQESGLYPMPGKLALEELELIERVAAAAGMAPGSWAAHTLLDAASKAAAGEERKAA